MTSGRDFLRDIWDQNNEFQRMFVKWIESYNDEGDLDILEVFGEMMLALDRFIDCRWGCDDDHPEKHLAATCVSNIRAILPLIACGYPSEAGALFRPLGETTNLMLLLTASRDQLEAYRIGNKRQRRKKFSAGKVRGMLNRMLNRMLKQEGFTAPQDARMYGLLSDFYLHPNTLDHIFAYRTSHEGQGRVIPYFHRDLCMSLFSTLISAASTALLFCACAQGDESDVRLAHAFSERVDKASRAFAAKMAQDPTVERAPRAEASQRAPDLE